MALVHLRNGSIWYVSSWALRELLALVTAELPGDDEASATLQQAEAFSALQLHLYEPDLAGRIEKAVLRVAKTVVDDRMPASPSGVLQDRKNLELFVEGLRELLKLGTV